MSNISGTAFIVLQQALDRIHDGAGLADFPSYEHEALVEALESFGNLFDVACAVVDGKASVADLQIACCDCTELYEGVQS